MSVCQNYLKETKQNKKIKQPKKGALYRGYFMAARGYEFYLRVLKVSLTSERSERKTWFSKTYGAYHLLKHKIYI